MTRTCIICGGPTGSREHIFPAALGGRRTNKGIYCGDHNNAYAGLARIISDQLDIFNALLGVVGDHARAPTTVDMTNLDSGQEVRLSNGKVQFKKPHFHLEKTENGRSIVRMTFNTQKEAEDWIARQKEQGNNIQTITNGQSRQYHVVTLHKQITLGGNAEGLRSVAYIAQTFFANYFPAVARLPELKGIKDYTLLNAGCDFAWWDFDPPTNLPPNPFPFGHRVIVGLNSEDGTAYARVSFFSTLDFSIHLGTVPVEASRAFIIDIDPLAKSPPKDINFQTVEAAIGAVLKPDDLSASLADAIHTGRAQTKINELMQRIGSFELETAAARIMKQIDRAGALPEGERRALFAKIASSERQRILNLMRHVAEDLQQQADPDLQRVATIMAEAVKLDPSAENGLSLTATHALNLACTALAAQMDEDCKAARLNQDRISMLIGGGLGAAVVTKFIIDELIMKSLLNKGTTHHP